MTLAQFIRPVSAPVYAVILLLIVLVAESQSTAAAGRERVEAFLQVTGFDVALDSIALSAGDAPGMLGMSESDFGGDWARVAGQVFDRSRMRRTALDILEQTLTDDALAHAADFYASPLGQRLVEVENASHMAGDEELKAEVGESLVAKGVAKGSPRIGYLQRMNVAIDVADNGVRAIQEIQLRFLMAASHAGVLDYEIDEGLLRARLAENEVELRLILKKNSMAAAAYTYREISDDDLAAYAGALEQPLMQEVYELLNAVQYEITASLFEVLAGRMADMHPGEEL